MSAATIILIIERMAGETDTAPLQGDQFAIGLSDYFVASDGLSDFFQSGEGLSDASN